MNLGTLKSGRYPMQVRVQLIGGGVDGDTYTGGGDVYVRAREGNAGRVIISDTSNEVTAQQMLGAGLYPGQSAMFRNHNHNGGSLIEGTVEHGVGEVGGIGIDWMEVLTVS